MVDHVIFSPRINLRYNPTEQINLRLNYAGGFRAPQTFDEDLHIALVGGERVVTQLAPDLREERSNSLSASIDLYRSFGSVETNLLVEGFYTALDHIFATRYLPEPNEKGRNGARTLQRRRSDRGRRQRRGEGGLLPLVRLAGRHHMAAQPLRTRPCIGATTRPTNAACSVRPTGTAT